MILENTPEVEKLIQVYLEGDDRCQFPIGCRVEKAIEEKGDVHLLGTQGTIMGNHFMDGDNPLELNPSGTYLVHFDGDAETSLTFSIDAKLKRVE